MNQRGKVAHRASFSWRLAQSCWILGQRQYAFVAPAKVESETPADATFLLFQLAGAFFRASSHWQHACGAVF